jgi:hypothetical protein
MTTSNNIISEEVKDVIFLPLEALHSLGDTLTYVFKKNGLAVVRQQVKVGKANSNEAIILDGVGEGDDVLLNLPSNPEDKRLIVLEGLTEENDNQNITSR